MDQNSTNGAGTDKRNWRERLGIGAKEMPKLSDEFRTAPPAQPPTAGTARPAQRAPQPVTRTAPMAPRSSAPKPVPQTVAAPAIARTTQRLAEPAAQDALAEKLRAQRAAAEKLAEQRVQAARERAEAKSAEVRAPAKEPTLNVPPRTPAAASPPATASAAARPKFSFADDEAPPPRRDVKPPAELPPRPALAATTPPLASTRPVPGERGQPPFLRPSASTPARAQPPLRADGQPVFRPVDPASSHVTASRLPPPAASRGYGAEPPAYGTRVPVRRPPADPYARSADARGYSADDFDDDPRGSPRLARPPALRSRTRPPEEDYEEVFEDEPAPRQRASARDYQNAYRDADPGYDEDQRRSSGPLLLLLGLLIAALVAGGAMWYYNTKIKTASTALPGTADNVPVIAAPEQPVKSAPEQPAEALGLTPAVKKKQIYDRIVGEQEVSGDQVVPTEEIPVQPEAAQPPISGQGQPEQGAGQIPAPDAPLDAATGQAPPVTEETAPLPLPPPPGTDTQGSLDQSAIEKIAAAAASPEQGATAPPGTAPAAATPEPVAALPPPPEKTTDGAVTISEPADAVAEPMVPPPAPAKKKAAAAKQTASTKAKKKAAEPAEDLGAEPVVLVPPSQAGSPIQGEDAASAPVLQHGAAPAPVKKKKTILDLFNRSSSDDAPEAPGQQGAVEQDDTQVASLPATATKKPVVPAAPQASAGSGYVVQLASFRSEDEAQSEFSRLRDRYPDVVGGLPSRISQTSAGGSTRYRLGLGPLASRDDATRVCNSLFSAGERDCLVRSQ